LYNYSKKFSKKGQFTLFVIVGLVILFSFAFLIYAKNKIVSTQMIAQADRQIKEYIDKYSIDQYVTSCLDAVSQDVITQAMIQGGQFNFTDPQNGEPLNFMEFNDTTYNRTINISIAVDANYNCPNTTLSQNQYLVYNDVPSISGVPDYPYRCGYVKVKDLESKYYNLSANFGTGSCKITCRPTEFNQYSGFFGINNLSRLCDSNGPNRIGVVSGNNFLTCDYYNNFNKSLQQAIDREIEKNIVKCVNFTEIRIRSSGGSNITRIGNATAVLTFKQGGYNIKLVYPFTILMTNRQPITRMIDFGIDKDIPFKELYEYTYELLNYDVKYPNFNIFKNYTNVIGKGYRRTGQNIRVFNYTVEIIEGNSTNSHTNVARITDNEHKLNGLPMTINVGIRERRPVLDFLHYTTSSKFDVVSIENKTMILSPEGYDPDDDNLSYNYKGWLEDYTEIYNNNTGDCETPDTLDYIIANCMEKNYGGIKPHNWTKSTEYIQTHQNASYKPLNKDKGFHNVEIIITDEHGLEDIQSVRILIFDLPRAIINVPAIYPDVPLGFASYEDKFTLDGGDSTAGVIANASGIGLGKIIWNDTVEPFLIIRELSQGYNLMLKLPEDNMTPSQQPITMVNIVDYVFRRKVVTPISPILHNISLTVIADVTGLSDTSYQEINITQCLNHSNPNNPSYPYNNDPNSLDDSLNANHTCCTDGMIYVDSSSVCFENTQYGRINHFTDYSQNIYVPFGQYGTYNYNNGYSANDPHDNNIYKQEFQRQCSGIRGNICSGDGQSTVSLENDCSDSTYLGINTNTEKCSGPPINYINSVQTTPTSCENYGAGQTFESLAQVSGATGNCNNNRACSPQQYNGPYGGSGNYYCYGQCDGNGGCTIGADCICDSSASCGTYGTDSECDTGTNFIRTCKIGASGLGRNFIAKTCDQCGLIDTVSTTCRSNTWDDDNSCIASSQCNGRQLNTPFPSNPHQGCNPTCQFIDCGTIEFYSTSVGGCPSSS